MFNSKAVKIYYMTTIKMQGLFNDFLLIHTHQDLLHAPHPLF